MLGPNMPAIRITALVPKFNPTVCYFTELELFRPGRIKGTTDNILLVATQAL